MSVGGLGRGGVVCGRWGRWEGGGVKGLKEDELAGRGVRGGGG